jgi:hypothetical protein
MSATKNFSSNNIKQRKPSMDNGKNYFLLNEDVIKNTKNSSIFINDKN